MTEAVSAPLFSTRERRILLWVCAAAVCWRWLLAVRTPLPLAVDELWAGSALAGGELAALGAVWLGPWWSLLLAPAIALGFDAFEAAQLLGSVVGGVALVPVAVAAQRLREGAGVPAAVLCFSMPAPTIYAAAGSPVALHTLWFGIALWAVVARNRVVAVTFLVIALADAYAPGSFSFANVRDGWSVALPLAVLAFVGPHPPRGAIVLWLAVGIAMLTSWLGVAWLPSWSPVVACLAGVGLARLPVRLRDLVLTAAVGFLFFESYHGVEPPSVAVERYLGEFLGERLPTDQQLVTDLPRVAFFAGRRPPQTTALDALAAALDRGDVGGAVLTEDAARALTEPLQRRFERFRLSPHFEDLAGQRDVAVWFLRQ